MTYGELAILACGLYPFPYPFPGQGKGVRWEAD